MKNLMIFGVKYILLGVCLYSASIFAAGPGSDGGGNGEYSTRAEVHKQIVGLAATWFNFETSKEELIAVSGIKDLQLKAAIAEIFGPKGSKLKSLLNRVSIQAIDGPCRPDGDVHTDASTSFHLGAEICFSVSRMMRYTRVELKKELTSLLFHEIAHQYGYDEVLAKKVQNFMKKKLEIKDAFYEVDNQLRVLDEVISAAQELKQEKGSKGYNTKWDYELLQQRLDFLCRKEQFLLGLSQDRPYSRFLTPAMLSNAQAKQLGYDGIPRSDINFLEFPSVCRLLEANPTEEQLRLIQLKLKAFQKMLLAYSESVEANSSKLKIEVEEEDAPSSAAAN